MDGYDTKLGKYTKRIVWSDGWMQKERYTSLTATLLGFLWKRNAPIVYDNDLTLGTAAVYTQLLCYVGVFPFALHFVFRLLLL